MTPTEEQQKLFIQIWSKAVDTQMHFNEMSVKSRQLGLTFVTAALGVGIVLLGQGRAFELDVDIEIVSFQLHVSVLIVSGAALALFAVGKLDLGVYHRMLRGAVTFGEDFEENYMKQVFELEKGMTQSISHYSRFSDASVNFKDGKYEYTGSDRKSAEEKIRDFYKWSIRVLWVIALSLFLITSGWW